MPQRFAIACIECESIAMSIAGEGKTGVSGEHTCSRATRTKLMTPAYFPSLVVDGFEHSLAPQSIVSSGPAIVAIFRLREIDAVAGVGIHYEQARLWIEARRSIVGHAAFVRRDETAIASRLFCRIGDGATLLIDTQRPIHWTEGRGKKALAIGAIQNEKVSVAGSLH